MEVIVEDSQLSLAIGKKGQNVRLAAKLLGWRIDIKTEEEKRQEVEAAKTPAAKAIIVADFIAGMTDRFAFEEHKRIFDLSYRLIGDE